MVSKHTPSQIVLRQSNSQQKTPSKRFASWILWGISSAGRALAWHARGQRFDPAILHQKSTILHVKYGAFLFAFLEVASRISQMPDFAGAWTATPNSCYFVAFENACSMSDCFAGCCRSYSCSRQNKADPPHVLVRAARSAASGFTGRYFCCAA